MRNIIVIMKKELKRFFTDRRLLMTLFLPGILIFIVYSLMGRLMTSLVGGDENYVPKVCVINEIDDFSAKLEMVGFKYEKATFSTVEDAKAALKEKKIDLVVEYEENFEEKRAAHESDAENNPAPSVKVIGFSTESNSSLAAATVSAALSMTAVEKVSYSVVSEDAATSEDMSLMIISMIVPMLGLMLLFSGCMAVTTESIAGEKERGTIATLLVTPVKRSYIAAGKIIALAITSLVSSIASFIGVIASLPNLLGGTGVNMGGTTGSGVVDLGVYGAGTYLGTFAVLAVTVLVFTVILAMVSTIAKSVKEASQLGLPVMFVALIAGITTMFAKSTAIWQFFIPIFNSAKCLSMLFSKNIYAPGLLITIGVNAVITVLGVMLLAKMFNSERVMFNK